MFGERWERCRAWGTDWEEPPLVPTRSLSASFRVRDVTGEATACGAAVSVLCAAPLGRCDCDLGRWILAGVLLIDAPHSTT